jgi:predicted phage terminase large subunit-like protein
VVEPGYDFLDGWHIHAIAEHLEAVSRRDIRKLIINIPPRHMKSLQCAVLWPAWEWIARPETRWLFATYAQSLSTRDSVKCRRLIESPWYQARWAERYQLSTDQNQKTRYENDKTGYRLAASVGGAMTGEGGDIIVIDDPHNATDIWSEAIRTSTLEWWDQSISTRLNDKKRGAYVIIMQRLHEQDLVGHILAKETGWDHLCLPAEYEIKHPYPIASSLGFADPRREEGELLWAEREGRKEIETTKQRLGSYATAGQLQQRPAPNEGGVFKKSWWKFYEVLPERFDQVVLSWDMAFKETKDSDYVVGQVWGKLGANAYLIDQVRARMDFPKTLAAFKAQARQYPQAGAKYVEDKANGPAVISSLQHEIPGLIAVNPEGGKEARAASVTWVVEAGNIHLPRFASLVDDFINECAVFPNGAHDDQVDAMTQALIRLFLKGGGIMIGYA